MLLARIFLLTVIFLTSACTNIQEFARKEINPRAHRAEVVAEREVRKREGWQHSTVFSRAVRDGYSVMVLQNDLSRSTREKMLVGASVAVNIDSKGKIVEYTYFAPHN